MGQNLGETSAQQNPNSQQEQKKECKVAQEQTQNQAEQVQKQLKEY